MVPSCAAKMLLGILLVMTSYIREVRTLDAKGTYVCMKSSSSKIMRFNLVKNDEMIAVIYGGDKADTCSLAGNQVTGQGTDDDPYELSIDLQNGLPTDPDCGVTSEGNAVFTLKVTTQKLAILTIEDKYYSFSCDFNAQSTQEVSGTTTVQSQALAVGDLSPSAFPTKLEFINKESDSLTVLLDKPVTATFLGFETVLRVTLEDSTIAKTIRVTSCVATYTDGEDFQLIGSDGCTSNSAILSDGFKEAVGSQNVAESPVFIMFAFPGQAAVTIKCQVTYCFTDTDANCPKTHCRPDARRKRETTSNKTVDTVARGVFVCPPRNYRCLAEKQGLPLLKDADLARSSPPGCLTEQAALGVITVLGIALVASLIFATCVCVKLIGARRKQQKEDNQLEDARDQTSHANHSYHPDNRGKY